MAVASIHEDNWRMFLSFSLIEMFSVEVCFLERFAPIAVLSWVMKTTTHGGAVVEVTKVTKR